MRAIPLTAHLSLGLRVPGRQRHPTGVLAIETDLESVLPGTGQRHIEDENRAGLDIHHPSRRLPELNRPLTAEELSSTFVHETDPYGMDPDFRTPPSDSKDEVGPGVDRGKVGQPHVLKDSQDAQLPLLVDQRIVCDDGKIEMQSSGNPDRGDDVILLNLVHDVHAFRHLAEDGMDPIQVGLGRVGNEKLAPAGVFPGMRH